MHVSRKFWPISLVIFTVWLGFIVVGGLLQIKGQHIQLEQLVKKQIMFGELVEIAFFLRPSIQGFFAPFFLIP